MIDFFIGLWYILQIVLFVVAIVFIGDIWVVADEYDSKGYINLWEKIVTLVKNFKEICTTAAQYEVTNFEKDRLIRIAYSCGLAILLSVIFHFSLYKQVIDCKLVGSSYNVTTDFSFYQGECVVITKSGAKIPVRILRDTPEGKEGDSQLDDSSSIGAL